MLLALISINANLQEMVTNNIDTKQYFCKLGLHIIIKVEPKISCFVDTCRCPLRGYGSYNNSNNLFVITFKPYEHIEIRENPEMLMVHYNYYSFDYCFFSTVKHYVFGFPLLKWK